MDVEMESASVEQSPPPPSGAAPPPGYEVVGLDDDWQVVISGGHAVLPEGMTHLPDRVRL